MLLWIQTMIVTWLVLGTLVALPFLTFAVGRVVEGAAGSSLMFRLMMLPGAVLLWPVVLRRWFAPHQRGGHA